MSCSIVRGIFSRAPVFFGCRKDASTQETLHGLPEAKVDGKTISSPPDNINGSPITLRDVLKKIGNFRWGTKVVFAALGVALIAIPLWQVLMLGASSLLLSAACIGVAIEIVLVVSVFLKEPSLVEKLFGNEGKNALLRELVRVDGLQPDTLAKDAFGQEVFELVKKIATNGDEFSENFSLADFGNRKIEHESSGWEIKFNATEEAIRYIVALSYIPNTCFVFKAGKNGDEIHVSNIGTQQTYNPNFLQTNNPAFSCKDKIVSMNGEIQTFNQNSNVGQWIFRTPGEKHFQFYV